MPDVRSQTCAEPSSANLHTWWTWPRPKVDEGEPVVVDELDAKKYARREEFQQRARELLTLTDRYVTDSAPDGYSTVREGVTVEVLPDEPGHFRAASNDQEILERCEFLHQATGNPVTLITGDSGMRINAQARGIDVFKLSDSDLLPRHRQ